MDNSTGSQPCCTEVLTDFDETFGVYRAFISKRFDKKNFFKKLLF
jgi:hypothetical protein